MSEPINFQCKNGEVLQISPGNRNYYWWRLSLETRIKNEVLKKFPAYCSDQEKVLAFTLEQVEKYLNEQYKGIPYVE